MLSLRYVMVTKAILSMRYFHLIQSKFDSVFVTVAQVSGNVTGYHLLVFCCFFFFSWMFTTSLQGECLQFSANSF